MYVLHTINPRDIQVDHRTKMSGQCFVKNPTSKAWTSAGRFLRGAGTSNSEGPRQYIT